MRFLTLLLLGAIAVCAPLAIAARAGADVRAARRARAAHAHVEVAPAHARSGVVITGDYEPQSTLLVAWDDELEDFFVTLISVAHTSVDVVVLLDLEQDADAVLDALRYAGVAVDRVSLINVPIDSVWMRDYGPLGARYADGSLALIDTTYFAGGADDDVPQRVSELLFPDRPLLRVPVRVEGGNLLSDGRGRCITTTVAYFGLSMTQRVAARVRMGLELGCHELVVLEPLMREETGHADMFAMVTGPGRVLVGTYDPDDDPDNAAILDANAQRLRRAGFAVGRLPMPTNTDGRFRSYTNALPLNDMVLVPVYADDLIREREALDAIAAAFPQREIIAIESAGIISLAGAVHCASMGVPR